MEEHLGAAHIAGDLIQPFVNPRGLAVAAALFIIGLPLCVRISSSFSISPASYTTAKLSALHFLFRMSYSQVRGELLSCPSECRRVMRIRMNASFTGAGRDALHGLSPAPPLHVLVGRRRLCSSRVHVR